jgi:hypothetical protein
LIAFTYGGRITRLYEYTQRESREDNNESRREGVRTGREEEKRNERERKKAEFENDLRLK